VVKTILVCQKLLKSAHAARSYTKNKSGTFFMDHGVMPCKQSEKIDEILTSSPVQILKLNTRNGRSSIFGHQIIHSQWSAVAEFLIVKNCNKKLFF